MALTQRYVTTTGAGAHDGTSEGNAFSWAEMVTDLNTPRAGYQYNIKSGTYANATTTTTLTGDGSTTSPNVLQGYATTPGDLNALGRASGGALDTTGFPAVSYTGTTARFNAQGATHLIVRCLSITSAASAPTLDLGTLATVENCSVSNTGTNAASSAIEMTAAGNDVSIINCDASTAATGAARAIRTTCSNLLIDGVRAKCAPGTAILVRSTGTIKNCTAFESTIGIQTDATSANLFILDNTIVNNTGDGIDIITGSTAALVIKGNHITGNGGYGIDFNTSTCVKKLGFNRLRDNASGNINGGGDWEEGSSYANVTSDDADADDFTDQSTDDYSLKSSAPARNKNSGYLLSIGASGANVTGGGGGGLRLVGAGGLCS